MNDYYLDLYKKKVLEEITVFEKRLEEMDKIFQPNFSPDAYGITLLKLRVEGLNSLADKVTTNDLMRLVRTDEKHLQSILSSPEKYLSIFSNKEEKKKLFIKACEAVKGYKSQNYSIVTGDIESEDAVYEGRERGPSVKQMADTKDKLVIHPRHLGYNYKYCFEFDSYGEYNDDVTENEILGYNKDLYTLARIFLLLGFEVDRYTYWVSGKGYYEGNLTKTHLHKNKVCNEIGQSLRDKRDEQVALFIYHSGR